jgi:Family of unknown function (DUF6703)
VSSNRPRPRRTANRRPAAPTARQRPPRPATSRRPAPAPTPATGRIRGSLERASSSLLVRLTRAPRWLVGLVPAVVLLGGLIAPVPWGPLLLGLVTLFLGWLLVLAWPALDTGGKALRTAVVVLTLTGTVGRAVGAF